MAQTLSAAPLRQKQERLAAALLTESSLKAAAEKAGYSGATTAHRAMRKSAHVNLTLQRLSANKTDTRSLLDASLGCLARGMEAVELSSDPQVLIGGAAKVIDAVATYKERIGDEPEHNNGANNLEKLRWKLLEAYRAGVARGARLGRDAAAALDVQLRLCQARQRPMR